MTVATKRPRLSSTTATGPTLASPRAEPTKVLLKGLAVLEAMLANGGEGGISELARAIDLDKATVHRLVNTLCTAGYVVRDPVGRYRLTSRFARFSVQQSPQSLMEVALPFMRALAKATGETAYVAVPNGDEAVFLDKIESEHAIRVHTKNGSRIPLYCGSAAKSLLAFAAQDVVERVLATLQPVTPFTISRPAALRRALEQIRRTGYAVGEQEWRIGVSGVSAPVRDSTGSVVAALAISGPSERLHKADLLRLAPTVVASAAQLSRALGHRPVTASP